MEEENLENNNPTQEIENEKVEEVQQEPLEIIAGQFKKLEEDIIKNTRYVKTLHEEIKYLKSTVKLLIEEVQDIQ